MTPETRPAELPPKSALSAQNALWAKYKAPAPLASTRAATRTSVTVVAAQTKALASSRLTPATPQRATRFPSTGSSLSEIQPPSIDATVMATNGKVVRARSL